MTSSKDIYRQSERTTAPPYSAVHTVYLLLGSNIGDRLGWLKFARKMIGQQIGTLLRVSHPYASAPWGLADQPPFINQALCVTTELSPFEVLEVTRSIEDRSGRQREIAWGPRTLDIDILFYDDIVLQTEKLTLPHPLLPQRNFALVPLSEIAEGLIHPVLQKSIDALRRSSPDQCEVAILPDR